MREKKNILNYGFLLFLIILGIVSIFCDNEIIIKSINSLSIPIFLFSITTLLSKFGNYMNDAFFKKILDEESKDKEYEELIKRQKQNIDECTDKMRFDNQRIITGLLLNSTECKKYLCILYKRKILYSDLVKAFNLLSMISFVICLFSIIGIVQFDVDCPWVNIFSLALVFFDFFILDDILKKRVDKVLKKLSEKEVQKQLNKN